MIMHDVPGDTQYICTPHHANPSSTTEYHDTHPPDSVNYEKILIILYTNSPSSPDSDSCSSRSK